MTKRRLWASLAVFGSVTLSALGRPAIIRVFHGSLPRFPYAATPLSDGDYAALAARPSWAKSSIDVVPGVSLNGLVRRPKTEGASWILFFPGNDPSQLTVGQEFLERLAGARNVGLAVYADRGFDSSGGIPSDGALREDGYRILTGFVAAERVDPARLHVVAFSMGTYVALAGVGRAAAEGRKVATLSLLAPVERMEMVHSLLVARLFMGDIFDSTPLLDAIPGPVLIVHGANDQTLNVSQGRNIAAKLGKRATFRELPGVGHLDIERNETALEAVREMIDRSR